MVVMEHLSREDVWQCLAELLPPPCEPGEGVDPRQLDGRTRVWDACVAAAETALRRAHGLRLEWRWTRPGGPGDSEGSGTSGQGAGARAAMAAAVAFGRAASQRGAAGLELPFAGCELPTVHGDLRIPNIMVRMTPDNVVEVRFVDFDSAGVEWAGKGGARCPTVIARALFPKSVVAGGALSQSSDRDTLSYSNVNSIPDWDPRPDVTFRSYSN